MMKTILNAVDYFLLPPTPKIRRVDISLKECDTEGKKQLCFRFRNGLRKVKNYSLEIDGDGRGGKLYVKKNIGSLKPFRQHSEEICEIYPEKYDKIEFQFTLDGSEQEIVKEL